MSVLGIIVEYNPFHYGHLHHLMEAKKLVSADYVVAVMSGNFLQRGEPAIVDKWARTEMALEGGVDIVIELPTVFACHNAGVFAKGSISLLNATGVVDYIVFGSEEGNLEPLMNAAQILANETENFKEKLHKYLKEGLPYPEAQSRALIDELNSMAPKTIKQPNNILAIEYLKQLLLLNSSIKPLTIKRKTAGYHDRELTGKISSATAIRTTILKEGLKKAEPYLPPHSYQILEKKFLNGEGPVTLSDFSDLIIYCTRMVDKNIPEAKEGIENRIKKAAFSSSTTEEIIEKIKTRRYTRTKIQRMLMHILIGLTEKENKIFQRSGPMYIRVLGLTQKGRKLLKKMKNTATLPLLTKAHLTKNADDIAKAMFSYDISASWIYNLAYKNTGLKRGNSELKKHPIIIIY